MLEYRFQAGRQGDVFLLLLLWLCFWREPGRCFDADGVLVGGGDME